MDSDRFRRLGVAGAALATNIGRGTGALFALSRLLKPGSRIDLHQRHFKLDLSVIGKIARVAWSAMFQLLIGMCSWIALTRILATFGSSVIAGYTIGIRVIMFALLPAAGLANAAATMVGQALGAKKPDRAAEAVRIAGTYNMVVLSVVGALLAVFAPWIARFFTSDATVIPYAKDVLRIVALGFPFYAWGMVISQSFNGAGDTRTPTLLNLFVFWCWEIPLAYVLAIRLGLGPRGIYVAMAIAFSTLAVAGALMFRRGTWKTKRLSRSRRSAPEDPQRVRTDAQACRHRTRELKHSFSTLPSPRLPTGFRGGGVFRLRDRLHGHLGRVPRDRPARFAALPALDLVQPPLNFLEVLRRVAHRWLLPGLVVPAHIA